MTDGAQALVAIAREAGIRHVFGVAGGKLSPLLHAISREPSMRYVGLRHEAAGPMMAAAIAAAGGGLAMALGEMGPGALNLLAGTGGAAANRLPVVLVTTNQHRAACYPHRGMFMDLDTRALFGPLVKWGAVVGDPSRLPELLHRALAEARGGAPGPVHLDIPHDVLTEACPIPTPPRAMTPPAPPADAVAEAAALLAAARRPLIVAGGGVVTGGAVEDLRGLAGALGAAVVPTQMAIGVVPSSSASFIGQGGIIGGEAVLAAFAGADLVLAVGCRFSSWLWDDRGPLARPPQRLIGINTDAAALAALPYDVALLADARIALAALRSALASRDPASEPGWLDGLRATRLRHEAWLVPHDGGTPMHPAVLARAIDDALPADALAVYDGGHTSFWSNDLTQVHAAGTRLHEPGMCQLGFGLPAAMALQLLHPGRLVVNITGDGSFGFTLSELDTARRERLPVVSIIHNNAEWGVIGYGQRKSLGESFGAALEGTDYAAIARGFGCHGETLLRPEELAPALARSRASGLPAVLDCRTRFEPHPCMPAFARMNRFGFGETHR
jgi:acetolactate synthase-1/2/3 large subunit